MSASCKTAKDTVVLIDTPSLLSCIEKVYVTSNGKPKHGRIGRNKNSLLRSQNEKKGCWCKWEESQIKPSYLKSAANNNLTAPKLKNPTLTFGYLIQRPTQIIRPIN